MTFPISAALVVVAILLLVAGVAGASGTTFVLAAAASAVAVMLLYRKIKQTRETPFVTDAPPAREPAWDAPLRAPAEGLEDERTPIVDLTEVGIEHYDELVASEVLPSLETMSVDQLRAVIVRERSGLGRQAIIRRAEMLIDLTLSPERRSLERDTRNSLRRGRSLGRRGPDLSI